MVDNYFFIYYNLIMQILLTSKEFCDLKKSAPKEQLKACREETIGYFLDYLEMWDFKSFKLEDLQGLAETFLKDFIESQIEFEECKKRFIEG